VRVEHIVRPRVRQALRCYEEADACDTKNVEKTRGYGKGRALEGTADLSVCNHNVLAWTDSPYSLLWDSDVWKKAWMWLMIDTFRDFVESQWYCGTLRAVLWCIPRRLGV
jgi:hypothetical protein